MRRLGLVLAALVALTLPWSAAAGPVDDEFYGAAGDDEVGDVRVVKKTRIELTDRERDRLADGDILSWGIEVDRRAPDPHLLARFDVERAVHRGDFPRWWRQQFGVRVVGRAEDGTALRTTLTAGARGTSSIPPREPVIVTRNGRYHSYCGAADVTFDRATEQLGLVVPLRCITRTGIVEGSLSGFVFTILETIGDDPKGIGRDRTPELADGPLVPVPAAP